MRATMGKRYTRSKKSKDDIRHIVQKSLVDFGEQQTRNYMRGLEETFQMLANTPNMGTVLAFSPSKQYRYHRYTSHVIYYRQRKADIFIVRILHKQMLPELNL